VRNQRRILRNSTSEKNKINKNFFYLIIVLTVLGLIFVADISAPQALNFFNDRFHFFKQQLISAIIGIFLMLVVSKIHYSFWKKVAFPAFVIGVLLLIAVLIPGISLKALGARRWIYIGGINFQPSEVIKLFLAMFLAKMADSEKKPVWFFVPLILVTGLIMLQPDLGTTLVVLVIGITQIFVSGIPILYFIGSAVVGIVGVLILILISPYRRDRLTTFFKVTQDPLGKAYHIRQILLAIGSGGLFGVGIGQSRQKYLFLPEAATDSIFAAISEEIGFIGSIVLIGLFFYFFIVAIKIAKNAPDRFSNILALGIAAWIGGQALINFSSMVALTPLTGIPLPFFSYGGTNLVMVLIGCGILLNISRYGNEKSIIRR
jgi:cell division protein FtsW